MQVREQEEALTPTPRLPPMIILCGGLGTRLSAVVNDRPKPMALIGDRPFLSELLQWYRALGVPHFVLAAGKMGDQIRSFFAQDSDVTVVVESSPLGTGGAVRLSLQTLLERNFAQSSPETSASPDAEVLVSNGDSFCAVNLAALVMARREASVLASLAVTEVDASPDYGRVKLHESGRISGFLEKAAFAPEALTVAADPAHASANTGSAHPGSPDPLRASSPDRIWINAGVYCFEVSILAQLPTAGSLERDLFPSLADSGQLYAQVNRAELLDIGTPDRLMLAQARLKALLSSPSATGDSRAE